MLMSSLNLPKAKIKSIETKTSDYISYNLQNKNNKFTTGFGFEDLALPVADGSLQQRQITLPNADISSLWYYTYFDHLNQLRSNRIMFLTTTGIYEFVDYSYVGNTFLLSNITSNTTAMNYFYDGKDYMIFSHQNGMFSYTPQESVDTTQNFAKFVDMTMYDDCLFAIVKSERNKIVYSNNLDPSDWSGTLTEISLTNQFGALQKFVYFEDILFVFCDYGIIKISKYSVSDDYVVENVFHSSSRIFPKTVVSCGDKVMFLTESKICEFNGNSVKDLNLDINKYLTKDNNHSCACFYGNQYFLACYINFNDGHSFGCESGNNAFYNNVLFVIDTDSFEYSITRGVDVNSLLRVQNSNLNVLIASFNSQFKRKIGFLKKSNMVFINTLDALCEIKETDFGIPNKKKTLKSLTLKTQNALTVEIKSEHQTRKIVVKGKASYQTIYPLLKGEKFDITIKSTVASNFTPPTFEVEYYD